jgi:hypothetical protein
MPPHTWRRQHGPDVVAEVTSLDGLGRWHASAWFVNNRTEAVRSQRRILELMSAQAMADHLARRTFDHTCDRHACGDWMFWPQGGGV